MSFKFKIKVRKSWGKAERERTISNNFQWQGDYLKTAVSKELKMTEGNKQDKNL